MVNNVIRFNCGTAPIEFNPNCLSQYRLFQQELEKRAIIDIAYIHHGHGHLLQVDKKHSSRDTRKPSDLYYNTMSSTGTRIIYDCKDCGSKFMFTIPASNTGKNYECFHFSEKKQALHYVWLSAEGAIKHAQHVDFFVRESDLQNGNAKK